MNISGVKRQFQLRIRLQISIFIIDINNNDPVFEDFEREYYIKEKSPNGTLVVQFEATDNDRDGKNIFCISLYVFFVKEQNTLQRKRI